MKLRPGGQAQRTTTMVITMMIASSCSLFGVGSDDEDQPAEPRPPRDRNVEPSWSPNGTHIAFTHYAQTDAEFERGAEQIWIYDVVERTIGFVTQGRTADWSGDSSKLLFVHAGDVWVMEVATLSLSRVTALGGVAHPQWSPTQETIAFRYQPLSQSRTLWTVAPDGTGLANRGIQVTTFGWSPDGREIVFTGSDESKMWRGPLDGSSPPVLVLDAGPFLVRYPRYGRDGMSVIFLRFGATNIHPSGLWCTDLTSGDTRELLQGAQQASWRPDGTAFAYEGVTPASNVLDLWCYDVAAGTSEPLVQEGAF